MDAVTATPTSAPADSLPARLLARLAQGLPLTPTPYADMAAEVQATATAVLAALEDLITTGAVSRFGVIVDHAALGFQTNAMVVWNIPAEHADAAGARIAAAGLASLCYRRETSPDWPYSVYTMLHGRNRAEIEARIADISKAVALPGVRHEALYTVKRYKQTAARYDRERTPA